MGKDILAIVDTGGKDGQFIGNAIALASRHDARLILGLACPIPVPGSPSAFGLPYATAAEFNEAVAAKEARIRSLARESGITVRIFLDDPVVLLRRLAAEASLSDVILFGSVESYGSPRFRSELVEAVVFASGRPVLLQPEGVGVETWKRIVIGWNGTREAGRALHAAMSIAPPEASFDIVTVTRPGEDARRLQPSAADVARHLEMLGRTAERRRGSDRVFTHPSGRSHCRGRLWSFQTSGNGVRRHDKGASEGWRYWDTAGTLKLGRHVFRPGFLMNGYRQNRLTSRSAS